MVALVQAVRQLAAEIVIRDRTGEGASAAAQGFEKVATAADGAATVVEKNVRATESAERAYQRLERFVDPLAKAQERFARDQQTLKRALDLGVISVDRYKDNLKALESQFERNKARIEQQERAQRGLNQETDRFGGVLGKASGLVAGFVAAFSFSAINAGIRQTLTGLDEIAKKARSLGGIETASFLQESRFAFGNVGIADGDKLLSDFQRRVGDLRLGRGETQTLLTKIEGGDSLAEALKNAGSLDEQFKAALETLNKMEDAAERAALAAALFGKDAGKQVGALAEAGVEGFEALREEARAAGLVIEEDILVRAELMSDQLSKAQQIVGVQLKRAFVELGPVLVYLTELAGKLLAGFIDFINRASEFGRRIAANLSPTDNADVDRARRQQSEAQATLDRIAEARRDGAPVADVFGVEARAQRRLAEATARIAALEAEAGEKAASGLQKSGAAIRDFSEEAAFAGDAARAFGDAAVNAGGRAARGFNEAARAAAAVKFDPIGDVEAEIARLQTLSAAGRQGPEALAEAEQRLSIEERIARVRQDAARLGRDFDDSSVETLRQRLEELAAVGAEYEDALRPEAARDAAQSLAREFDAAFRTASDGFWDNFVRTGKFNLRGLAIDLRSTLLNAAVQPLRTFTANLFSGFGQSVGGGVGLARATPAGGGAVGGGILGGAGLLGVAGLVGSLASGSSAPALLSLLGPALGAAGGAALVSNLGRLGLFGSNLTPGEAGIANFLRSGFGRAGQLGNIAGGLAGAIGAAALFGNSTGTQVGSIAGGIAGNFIPIPVLGPLIGSAIGGALGSLFGGKPSDNAAGGGVSFTSFAPENQFVKNNDPANIQARDQLLQATAALARQLAELTGASFLGSGISIQVGSRDGTRIISAAGGDKTTPVGDVAAAQKEIVRQLTASLTGGDAALVAVAKAFGEAGRSIEDIAQRLGALKALSADSAAVVDPLRDQIDAIVDAFEGLDVSAGALKTAFDGAIDALAARVTRDTQRELDRQDNPALAAINDILDAQAARRTEIERLAAQGGSVDPSLLAEFQRRQLLSQFNIDTRFKQATDAAAFGIEQLLKAQAQERDAFRRAIEGSGGLLTQADFLGLVRAQEAERFQAFRQLSDEDKARLSGRVDFDDLTNQYALALDRLIEETERFTGSLEAERQRLETAIATRAGEVASLTRSIDAIDTRRGAATPGETLDRLRAQIEDLRNRALSDDETTRAAARAALPDAIAAYADRLEQVFGSGAGNAAGLDFARGVLDDVRARAQTEKTQAERQLAELQESRQVLEDIRELLAAPRLDIEALVAASARLSPDNPIAIVALQLADLEARMTAQTDRLVAALEALTPADVGLGPVSAAADAAPPASASLLFAASPAAANDTAPAGAAATSTTPSGDGGDVAAGLFAVAEAIESQTAVIINLDARKRPYEERQENYLSAIATRRLATL